MEQARIKVCGLPAYSSSPATGHCFSGGEGGIRTHGTLLTYTHFPGVPDKPLLHLSELVTSHCLTGGEGGIRTHGTLAGTPVFETGALNRTMRPLRDRLRSQTLRFKKA